MENKTMKFGKIRYIEPNILSYDADSKDNSFNIVNAYEDYSISVDLIVSVPNRIGGIKNKNGIEVSLGDSDGDNGSVSFFNGTDELLTDKPGTITYRDILNNESTKENLGITKIHITYDSYFYPTVTIMFSDVRGNSLMMPNEENYMRTEVNNVRKQNGENPVYSTQVESFFTSLFSFPYPEFKLQVKGFYGKKVEYSLLLSDFKSSFNNQTGNFDATVKFIGKMYGVYTDIPMAYLYISPYCKYGGKDNLTKWEENDFKFDDGTSIPTFVQLRDKIITANHEIETNLNYETVSEFHKIKNMSNLIQEINNKYSDLLKYIKSRDVKSGKRSLFFTFKNIIFSSKYNDSYDYLYNEDNSLLLKKTKELNGLITKFNNEFGSKIKIPYITSLENADRKIGVDERFKFLLKKANNEINISYIVDDGKSIESTDKGIILEFFTERKNMIDDGEYEYYIASANKFSSVVKDYVEIIKKEEEDLEKKAKNDVKSVVKNLLGFEPTIKNIFKIIMSHLQTFVQIFETFISNTTGTNARKLSDYGLSHDNTSDVPSYMLDLPPFPSFKNSDGVFCYPDHEIVTDVMEETVLIDALFDSTFDFMKDMSELDKKEKSLNNSIVNIPTCVTDFSNGNINVYYNLFKNNYSNIGIDWIFTYFGVRCIIKYLIENNVRLNDESFGKCEAYNLWTSNLNLSSEIIDKLKSDECNGESFVNFLLNNNSKYVIDGIPCYADNKESEKLLIKRLDSNGKESLSLSNDYHFPAMISRFGDDIYTFFDDYYNYTYSGIYSFRNGKFEKNRPYGFIKFIDSNDIEKWNMSLSSMNLDGICSENEKNNLIEPYTKITKNLFTEKDNIIYSIKENDDYFTMYTKEKKFDNLNENMTLNEFYNNNFSKGNLNCISKPRSTYGKKTSDIVPIFFYEGLTPEIFLCNVPHNLNTIVNALKNGGNILTLPKITALYIGMFISKIKRMTKDEFISFYQNNIGYNVDILKNIAKIITCLTRNTVNEYNDDIFSTLDNDFDNAIGAIPEIISTFYDSDTQKTIFEIDFLGLGKLFDDWCIDTNVGSFKYFYQKYALKLNDSDSSDLTDDLLKFCLTDLIDKNSNKNNNIEIKNALNERYSSIDDINDTESFTQRYSNIHLIKTKDKITKSYKNDIYLSFNKEFSAYYYLDKLFKDNFKLVIPYRMESYKNLYTKNQPIVDKSRLISSFNNFKSKLIELYTSKSEDKNEKNESEHEIETDKKLSMYRTLKNLYDRHFYSLTRDIEKYDINNENSEFKRFHFIDTFYNNIGDELFINLDTINGLLDNIVDGYSGEINTRDESIYSFMGKICQNHGLLFLALPVFNTKEDESYKDMFTPMSYNSSFNENPLKGPSYVCIYTHQPSQHLDIPDSQYNNDGFNIIDLNDTGNFTGPLTIPDLQTLNENDPYVITAFGVEYGSQKQSIFKNININMDNPQTTEVAVSTMFSLANNRNEDMQKVRFNGQDLYKVYSNYSYTCQVEMMGCAQIMPLMYFQLNNIPMFRGAYQIIQVEHDITPGDMTTSFKGVRLNNNKMPIISNPLSLTNMKDILNNNNYKPENNVIPMNIQSLEDTETKAKLLEVGINIDSEKILSEYPNHIKFNTGQKEAFNNLNPNLRSLIYCIVSDMKELSKKIGYTIGVFISSSTREKIVNGNNSSDHTINGTPSKRRLELRGLDGNGVEKSYAEMGCAVDMYGTRNGEIDKGESSITLFKHIAIHYSDYIRQLIWEVKGQAKNQDSISLIHLASYGKVGKNGSDKNEIFLAEYPSYSGRKTGSSTLPNEFLKILRSLFEKDLLTNGKTQINNFSDNPHDLTLEKLNKRIV